MIFQDRRKNGKLDLEALEMAMRSAMHQAGAGALSRLLQGEPPGPDQRERACSCGQTARYRELRSRRILTAVGEVELLRPYYLCSHCHNGQFPFDAELDVEGQDLSPGVRRMLAVVGSEAPFDHGRQQIELLAGLAVTTKAVERTAETIGSDIARCEQVQVDRALQLDLPIVVGEPIPILYVQMDGTGVPVVKKETEGRTGKVDGQPAHTREGKLGCAFTQTKWDADGYAIRDPDSTTYTGAIETASEFGQRIYLEAWNRGWSRAETKVVKETAPSGSGTWPPSIFPAPFRSSICFMPASTSGLWCDSSTPVTTSVRNNGFYVTSPNSMTATSKSWSAFFAPSTPPHRNWPKRSESKPTTLRTTPHACATPSSAANTCSSVRA